MLKRNVQIAIIVVSLFIGLFTLAQTTVITPSSPSVSICSDTEGIFTIRVTNTGLLDITNVVVRAQVPTDYSFLTASGSHSESGTPPLVTWNPVATLAAGDFIERTITISPNCTAPNGRELSVTITYAEGGPLTATSGPITVLIPNLVLEFSPSRQIVPAGGTANWDINVKNTGVGTMYNVAVVATIGSGMTLTGGTLTATIPEIAPGATVTWAAFTGSPIITRIDSCKNLMMLVSGSYGGCGSGGTDPCGTATAEGGVELQYRTPNLDYAVTTDNPTDPSTLNIPYCSPSTVTVTITNTGATAGNIKGLYMGLFIPGAITLVSSSYPYGPMPAAYDPSKSGFNVGDIPAGGSATLTFQVGWSTPCNPLTCDTLIFEPYFTDDCGDLFQPPVKELPVHDPPPRPSFTVTKTMTIGGGGGNILDEGETATFDITVTYHGFGTEIATADIQDTYPTGFDITDSTPAADTHVGNVLTWANESFTNGQVKHYLVDVTAHYGALGCAGGIANRAEVIPTGSICGSSCPPVGATAAFNLFSSALLTVDKTGDNLIYYNDTTFHQYDILVTYTGPLAAGAVVPSVRVVDTFPSGADVVALTGIAPNPPPTPSGGALTWDIPAGYAGWTKTGDVYTLTLSVNMRITTTGGGDPCDCGTTVTNGVIASLTSAGWLNCSANDSITVGVQCDTAAARFNAVKTVAPTNTAEICDCAAGLTYTNRINFTAAIPWGDLYFNEQLSNGQQFLGGGTTGDATFRFNDGGTLVTETHSITLGSELRLSDLPASITSRAINSGDWIEISYTLCFSSSATAQTFLDWSDIRDSGYVNPCATGDTSFHIGVWVTATSNPPAISISDFCKFDAADNCTFVINKCDDALFKIKFTLTNPAFVVRAKVDLQDNYTYKDGTSFLNGAVVANPSQSGQELTWELTNPATPGVPLAPGDYELAFHLYKDCEGGNAVSSWMVYKNRCLGADITTATRSYPYHTVATREGSILIKKTPEVVYSKNREDLITWVIYVTNRGSGVATNINVFDVLDTGLQYDTAHPYTVSGLDPGATENFTNPDGHNLTWVVSSIDPGRTVEITLNAVLVTGDCSAPEICTNLNNQVYAKWGCGDLTGGTCPIPPNAAPNPFFCQYLCAVTSVVKVSTTSVIITQFSATAIDYCETPATVTLQFRNNGDASAYCPVVTITMPTRAGSPSLVIIPGTTRLDGVLIPEATVSGNDRIWDLTTNFASGVLPGTTHTITFDVRANGCNYQNGDTLRAKIDYKSPCLKLFATSPLSINTVATGDTTVTISKTPDPAYAEPDDSIAWTLTLTNTGGYRAKDVKFWDSLLDGIPADVTFVSLVPVTGPAPTAGSGTAAAPWELGDMPVGAVWTYTINGVVKTSPVGCDNPETQRNQAHVSWGCCTIQRQSDSVSARVYTTPSITLSQSAPITVTNCGGRIRITLTNDDGRTPAYNILVHDVLPTGLIHNTAGTTTITSNRPGGHPGLVAAPAIGAGTGDLTWNSTNIPGYIDRNETITIEFDVIHTLPAVCNTPISSNNTITVTYDDVCGNGYSRTSNVMVSAPLPIFGLDIQPKEQVRGPGETAVWTTTIRNTGGRTENGSVTITDVLGDDFVMGSVSSLVITTINGSVTGTVSGHTITWNNVTLEAGEVVTYTLQVNTAATGNEGRLSNTMTVSGRCASGCLYASVTDVAYVGYTNIIKTIVPTTATIGETVPVTIASNYYGSGTNYTTVVVTDTLPVGLEYVTGTASLPPSSVSGTYLTGQVITWNLGDFTGTQNYTITFDTVVKNNAVNNNNNVKTNTAATTYLIGTRSFSDSATDSITLTEPVLVVTKNENDADNIVVAGQSLIYTVTAFHTGASTSNAFDLVITDVVPDGLTVNTGTITGGGTYNSGTRTITWNVTSLTRGAGTISFTYTAVVDGDVVPNQVLTNTTHLTWTSLHDATSGEHPDRRTGTGTAPNDYFSDTTNTVRVDTTSSITKTLNTPSDVTIGSGAGYTITVHLPRATIPSLIITDVMGEGLRFVTGAGNATVTLPDGTTTAIDPTVAGGNGGAGSTTLRWNLGSVDASTVANPAVTITFSAVVANTIQNQNGDTITNTGSYVFTGAGGFTGSGSASSANLNVHEPNLTVTKAHALVAPATFYEAGATIEYTLTVTNNGTSTAHNVVVTDVTAAKMTGLSWVSGGDSHSIVGDTITYTITSVAVGATVTLRYRVTVDNTVNPNELLTNNVTVTWESLASGPERRTGSGTGPNDYITTTSDSVRVNNAASIAKTPDTVRNVTILSVAPYTITVTLPRATVPALSVVENVRAGLTYETGSARVAYPASPGSPVAVEPARSGSTDGTGTSTLTWDFTNLNATSGNPLTITFNLVVADLEQNKDGDNIANSATATGGTLDFGGGSHTGTDSSADIHLMIPAFRTTKGLVSIIGHDGTDRTAAGEVEPGDTVTYTYTIQNIGSGDAENVVITDTLPLYFTFVSTDRAGEHWDAVNRRITWDPFTLAGNSSVTVSVVALVTHDLIKQGTVYTNVVHVAGNDILGNAIPGDNSIHFPTGTISNDTDNYTIGTAHIPAFIVDKTVLGVYDGASNPVANPSTIGPGEHADYRVVVTNVGDGTAYDVDVSDTLPTGLQYGDPAPPMSTPPNSWTDASWNGTHAGSHRVNPSGTTGTIVWDGSAITGDPDGIILSAGASLTLTYRVYANSEIVHLSTITNYAQAWGVDGSGTAVVKDRHVDIPADTNATDSSQTTLIGRLPFLVTDKIVTAIDGNTANTTVAVVDSVIDYETTFTNVGLSDAFAVNLYDTMPIGFEYVPGSANLGEPVIVGRELSWEVAANIATGDTLTLTFQLRVTDGATGGQATNHVWAEGMDGNSQPIIKNGQAWCPADTDSLDAHDVDVYVDIPNLPLILKKSVTPRSIGSGGVVHYTVSFTNNRKISFYDATITDTLPAGFRYLPGTALVNGARAADPVGNNPYTFAIGTVPPESVTTLDYYVLVSHSARRGANVNTAVLNAHDGAGKPISLTDKAVVVVKEEGFVDFESFPFLTRTFKPTALPERPRRPEEKQPRPECCLHVALVPVRSQDFGDTVPGYPEIYYQTDIAMYGATEMLLTEKRMNPWLEVQGFDPERKYLMTGLYNRMITKLGEYAQYNLGNVVMESMLGIPFEYAPGVLDRAKRSGTSPERAGSDLIKGLAERAGLSKAPDIQPIFLEYFGSYPYLHDRIADDKLAWEERLMDKNIMPAALGFTLLREASQIEIYLASSDPTDRFFGLLMLTQALEKTKSISTDLAKTAEFSPPVKYLPHFSRIEVDKAKPGLVWRTTDKTSTLYDHASVLWGLAKLRSVVLHSSDPEVRKLLPEITERMEEVYRAIEAIHYNKEGKTFVSIHSPEKAEADKSVNAKDLAFTILALRSVLLENRDLSINTIDPQRKIVEIADFMIDKLMGDDGGIYTSYNYADNSPVVGTKRTLVDNALAVRALLSAYVVTEDRTYRNAALKVYAFMVKELWLKDLLIFVDEENPDYEVVLTPQSIGALIGALRDLVLYGDPEMRHDYLDRMSYTTDRILDQSQLQLYENRFFPWHAPLTIVPEDPNGRSYVKPIITTIRDKGISHDLAPILVRKMVLNITPAGAIATGNEDKVSDWNKWKANLRYEVPDLIASSVIDDTFVTDEGMYFTTLTRDYRNNLNKDLPGFNPYHTDPGIQVYGAFVGDEVSRFNVKNLTVNSGMGIRLSESELVRRLAKKYRVDPDDYVADFVNKRVPRDANGNSIFGRLIDAVKGTVGLDRGGRFSDIIYLEYASGKPYYDADIADGWNEKTFDKKLTVSSISSTMVRQLLFVLDSAGRTDLTQTDRFVNEVLTLSVAAKRVALGELIKPTTPNGRTAVPHSFIMVQDEKEKRQVPQIVEKKATLFDEAFAIWAMALYIDARDRGLFKNYRPLMGTDADDEKLLSGLIDALMADHYNAEYGTLVTGSVNTVDVSKALDMLTRAADVMDKGPAREKLTGLIKKQADFITNRLVTETGFAAMVGLGNEKIPTDLCKFETLGTNVFPILALVRTWEVTGEEKYLKTALTCFDRFDDTKWDQAIGLYLSSGTVYKAPDISKLELNYNNQELIAAVLLISKLQPHLSGERKILSAYHMTTFMNRIMEIASVERYPQNKEPNDGTVFSPEIIRSVKIILSQSKGIGKPGDVFTNRIIIDNDCRDLVDRTLSRIRIEETLPDGFHYVPGSTRFNGSPGPDPIGMKTLNWYSPSLKSRSRLVIDYQVVADPGISEGSYTTSLDVLSFWGFDGKVTPCIDRNVTATTVIKADPFKAGEVETSCVPCGIGRRALSR